MTYSWKIKHTVLTITFSVIAFCFRYLRYGIRINDIGHSYWYTVQSPQRRLKFVQWFTKWFIGNLIWECYLIPTPLSFWVSRQPYKTGRVAAGCVGRTGGWKYFLQHAIFVDKFIAELVPLNIEPSKYWSLNNDSASCTTDLSHSYFGYGVWYTHEPCRLKVVDKSEGR